MTLLSDFTIRRAKPAQKAYTIKDGDGLFLRIEPNGSKIWHFRFYWVGKQKLISFGTYPEVDLKTARQKREEARALVAQNKDPRIKKKQLSKYGVENESNCPTFAQFSEHWKEFKLKKLGVADSTRRQSTRIQIQRYLRKDMLPTLGELPLNYIDKPHVLKVLREIEDRGALSIAEKCRSWMNELFRHAIAEGLIKDNPVSDLDVLALPQKPTLHNPFLKMSELPEFLQALRQYDGLRQTQLGIRLLLLTGVRTGELREAKPEHFDLENALWNVPPETVKQLKRKVRSTHDEIPPFIVPLSRQAIEVVQELLDLRAPWQTYLLCHRTKPTEIISENTLNSGLKRIGYHGRLTGHGIRATLSTALNELGYRKEWIEAQLSHSDKDQIRASYNHAEYVEQRRGMMQDWANKLDEWERQRK
ncbi:tyrosine-type recombinase/integrase [Zophobihabitans entericus]|uniref:Tyrosine-type recombinase/integrase n=1 Tax=Zophobihabitans entericus TaxID=1635327 RepID=A0A6G9ID21_9GAMM|nr:integrase arm-type DNA-binding domain-containing protein [Zophobihabitans entericus]QIQ21480.1 tyrosine-type recombinase/integrase [Zophobihabitans entericus]